MEDPLPLARTTPIDRLDGALQDCLLPDPPVIHGRSLRP